MTKGKNIDLSTRLSREDVAGILEAFSEGLKEGLLNVQKSGDSLELDVPKSFDLEIKAAHDNGESSFQIIGSWRTDSVEKADESEPLEKEKIFVTIGQGSPTLASQEILQSAETFLKQTATTVSSLAKEVSIKATEVLSKATEKGLNKAASQKTSSTLAKFAETALQSFEQIKEKAQNTFQEIKKDAEEISAKKKEKTDVASSIVSENQGSVEEKIDSIEKNNEKVMKSAEKTLEKKKVASTKKIATAAKKTATKKEKKAVAKKASPKSKSAPRKKIQKENE